MRNLFVQSFGILVMSVFVISGGTRALNISHTLLQPAPVGIQLDTITKLVQMAGDSAIWKHHGLYTLVVIEDNDDETAMTSKSAQSPGCQPDFTGKLRSAAKLSFATTANQTYSSMRAMQATLKPDSFMQRIGLTSTSARKVVENRNISITTAFLYGIARESDDDFHLIVGDSGGVNLLNCEISGLPIPSAKAYPAIKKVRNYVINYMGGNFCSSTGYRLFYPPLPITISGSLFYDVDHLPGSIGPLKFRPLTSWEIHPIKGIHF